MFLGLRIPSNIKSRWNLPPFESIAHLQLVEEDISKGGWRVSIMLSPPILIGVVWNEIGEPELGATVYSHDFFYGAFCLLEMIPLHIVLAVFEFQDHLKKTIKNPNKSLWRERSKVKKIDRVVEKYPQALILAPSKRSIHLRKKNSRKSAWVLLFILLLQN